MSIDNKRKLNDDEYGTINDKVYNVNQSANQPKDSKQLFEIFRELMKEKNISSTASWEFTLKTISNDPRYELFKHHPERKQMFNSYKTQKVKEEKEEQRMKVKRAKENLEKYLQNSPLVNSALRYRQAVELFRENEYWKAVPESDRREIFEDVVKYLSEKEKKELENLRRRNMSVLSDILDSMPMINHRTCWADAQQMLLDNPAFSHNSSLLNMEKEDALIIFTEHIRQLEQDEDEEKANEKKRQFREKRKNREKFIEFLDELNEQGKLTCISKWCNLYQDISSDPRFFALLTHFSGSTPLDLFKFYVENLKRRYEEDKYVIKQILKENQFQMQHSTTYDEFVQLLKEDERGFKLDSNNVKMMYDKLVDRAKDVERERLKELNKSKRKREIQFLNLLAKLEPPIDENTQWEDIRPKVENEDISNEFNETERMKLFESYLQSLEESCTHHHSKSRKQKKLKKTKYVHSSSSSISSDLDNQEREQESMDYNIERSVERNSERRKSRHHHKSRSHSGSISSSHKRSRSPLSRSPIYERHHKRHHQRHLDMISDNENDNEEDNQEDLEDLERQRQLLLQQLKTI